MAYSGPMGRSYGVGKVVGRGIVVVALSIAATFAVGCSRDSDSSSSGQTGSVFRNLGKR